MKKSIIIILFELSACRDSYEVQYYENGTIKSKAKAKNGIYHGDFITFYPNGQVKSRGFWENGLGNGYIERFFQGGIVEEKASWKDNKLHGPANVYYGDGKLRLSANFHNGCKVGDYIIYNQSQVVSEKGKYDADCNLYYTVKYDSEGYEELELFYPIFSIASKKDLIDLCFASKLEFAGEAFVTMGKEKSAAFIPISSRIELNDKRMKNLVYQKISIWTCTFTNLNMSLPKMIR